MPPSRYERPDLSATRRGIPDAALIVDDWLCQVQDLQRGWVDHPGRPTVERAYDTLALHGKLRRTRNEYLGSAEAEAAIGWLNAMVGGAGARQVIEVGLALPDCEGWLDEARLYCLTADELEPAQRAGWAESLVTDLDDADLVLYAAESAGLADDVLANALAHCQRWFVDHVIDFLAASVWAQAVGMTLRPDLEEEPGLCLTAEKYVRILDATAAMERELAGIDLPPLPIDALRPPWGMVETPRQGPAVRIPRFEIETPYALQAAAEEPVLYFPDLCWKSPDGRYEARLAIPRRIAGDTIEEARLTILNACDDQPLYEAQGWAVRLAGVSSMVDDQGRASFTWSDLHNVSGQPAVLEVGPNHEQWHHSV